MWGSSLLAQPEASRQYEDFLSELIDRITPVIEVEESSLEHLSVMDRDLLLDALRHSGVEVHEHCIVEQNGEQTEKVMLIPSKHQQFQVRYHPSMGYMNLSPTESSDSTDSEWIAVNTPVGYPFPFGDFPDDDFLKIYRPVLMDLSSIRPVSRDATSARYTALPSKAMMIFYLIFGPDDEVSTDTGVADERDESATRLRESLDGIPRDLFSIEFVVDLQSRRIAAMSVNAKKTVRIGPIRIRELKIDYELGWDEVVNRHVVKRISEEYRGSIAAFLRGRITFDARMSYIECLEEPPVRSTRYMQLDNTGELDSRTQPPTTEPPES